MTTEEILEKVRLQELSVAKAQDLLTKHTEQNIGYQDVGFARLDTDRKKRTGFAEVVYCEGKTVEQVVEIYRKIYADEGEVLGTRASLEQYTAMEKIFPGVEYDSISRILKIEKEKERIGKVVVCCAGTADIYAAREAALTASFFGCNVVELYDVGVCGLHRLLDQRVHFLDASCIIAVAGMEGALASVIGGLVSCPVIAVPTSVGYGANMHGMAALLTMVNSCSNGVSVVNIDNGYGAGYIATQINRLACGAGRE